MRNYKLGIKASPLPSPKREGDKMNMVKGLMWKFQSYTFFLLPPFSGRAGERLVIFFFSINFSCLQYFRDLFVISL
jgi:hypothetical protein